MPRIEAIEKSLVTWALAQMEADRST